MSLLKTLEKAVSNAIDIGEDYLESTERYFQLKIFQKFSSKLARIIKMAIIGGILFIGIFFLSVAGSIALGHAFNNLLLGYVAMAMLFIMVAFIIYLARKTLIDRMVLRNTSKTFFNNSNEYI
jgi:hypothetical protein